MFLLENVKHDRDIVIHCLRAKRKVNNPEKLKVVDIEQRIFSHTNSRNKTYFFKVLENKVFYNSAFYKTGIKNYSCDGFYKVVVAETLSRIYFLSNF